MPADWNEAGAVEHVFTHFSLNLRLLCAEAEARNEGIWWPVERLDEAGLPTVFAKAAARAAGWREQRAFPFALPSPSHPRFRGEEPLPLPGTGEELR